MISVLMVREMAISFEDFKILSSSSFEYELLLQETLLISELKPSLNANIGSALLLLLQPLLIFCHEVILFILFFLFHGLLSCHSYPHHLHASSFLICNCYFLTLLSHWLIPDIL